MSSSDRHHIVLVPGFAGFEALGMLNYFPGVHSILAGTGQEASGHVAVHAFAGQPTAGINTRARYLREWISSRFARGLIGRDDTLHLVAHSTGGVDIRQMMIDLRERPHERCNGIHGDHIVSRLASVQFLSTPHRGSNLARWANQLPLPYHVILRGLYEYLRLARPRGAHGIGRLLGKLVSRGRSDDWIDAIVDTMRDCYAQDREPYDTAFSRSVYFASLNWLLGMAQDTNAINDLDPDHTPDNCPAHATEEQIEQEARFLVHRGIRTRSILTVARPSNVHQRPTLYSLLHDLIATDPPVRFRGTVNAPILFEGGRRTIEGWENDGIVNTVSMAWPGEGTNHLLVADHADIMGHFEAGTLDDDTGIREDARILSGPHASGPGGLPGPRPDRTYDLLISDSRLNRTAFERVWNEVRHFALSGAHDAQA